MCINYFTSSGSFYASDAIDEEESVLALATDKENSILLSGDTMGHVYVWDIEDYCVNSNKQVRNMWHDQGKWVTCRKFQFLFSCTTFSNNQYASFWSKPHNNLISGYWVMKNLSLLKTI